MHILFAAAELAPIVKVGGLGEAATGLVRALRAAGHSVDIVVPDYGLFPTAAATTWRLDVAPWAAPATASVGHVPGVGSVIFVDVPGIRRHHPYVHIATGEGWADNDRRFFAFSAAVAALAQERRPDVLHLNDWHTATALAAGTALPTVFTVHNLAHQGWADPGWLTGLGPLADAFDHEETCNPLAGALRLADAVVAVSPSYAAEIVEPGHGAGLETLLAQRLAQGDLVGIRNGIDTERWSSETDELIPATFTASDLAGREVCQKELRRHVGFDQGPDAGRGPLIGMVARLAEQKGIDLALALVPLLETLPGQLVMIGDGDPAIAAAARATQDRHPGRFAFAGYDDATAHLIAAGADLMLVPSRFEPCGLTQMEAMAFGAIPVATAVGGLRDTVIDADRSPSTGTGFLAAEAAPAALVDALHRAVRAWRVPRRRQAIQRRGMRADWSWREPAAAHVELYERVAAR